MTFSKIQCFLMAAKTLNFTEAAEKIFITQPVLSRQISSMEEELGITLFNRKKKVSLTKAGESLATDLARIWDEYITAIQKAKEAESFDAGKIRIGIYDGQSIINDPRNEILRLFQTVYSSVKYVYYKNSISNLIFMLKNGTLDLIFGCEYDYSGQDIFEVFNVCKTRSYIVLSKNHPLASLKNPTLKDFEHEKFLVPDESESPNCKRDLTACFKRAGLNPPEFVTVPDIGTRSLWLSADEGVMVETSQLELHWNESFKFIYVPEIGSIPMSLIWKRDNKKMSQFVKFIRSDMYSMRSDI